MARESEAGGEVARIRDLLEPIEQDAADLPWSDRGQWRVATHVGHDGSLPVVDLHGLSSRLAKRAVRTLVDAPPEVGIVWVHGRGGSRGKKPGVLFYVVRDVLGPRCAEHGWTIDPQGARTVWITDPERAPTAGMPWVVILVGVLFGIGVVLTLTRPWWDV